MAIVDSSLRYFFKSQDIDDSIKALQDKEKNLKKIIRNSLEKIIPKKFPGKTFEEILQDDEDLIQQLEEMTLKEYQAKIKRKLNELYLLKNE